MAIKFAKSRFPDYGNPQKQIPCFPTYPISIQLMTTFDTLALGPVGPQEMMIILVILLLLFGAKKLPELARGMGKSMGEFKKAKEDFEHEITRAADDVETSKDKKSVSHSEDDRS